MGIEHRDAERRAVGTPQGDERARGEKTRRRVHLHFIRIYPRVPGFGAFGTRRHQHDIRPGRRIIGYRLEYRECVGVHLFPVPNQTARNRSRVLICDKGEGGARHRSPILLASITAYKEIIRRPLAAGFLPTTYPVLSIASRCNRRRALACCLRIVGQGSTTATGSGVTITFSTLEVPGPLAATARIFATTFLYFAGPAIGHQLAEPALVRLGSSSVTFLTPVAGEGRGRTSSG